MIAAVMGLTGCGAQVPEGDLLSVEYTESGTMAGYIYEGRMKLNPDGTFVLKAMKENYGPLYQKQISKEDLLHRQQCQTWRQWSRPHQRIYATADRRCRQHNGSRRRQLNQQPAHESLRTTAGIAVHLRGAELREPLRLPTRRGQGRYGMDGDKPTPLEQRALLAETQ